MTNLPAVKKDLLTSIKSKVTEDEFKELCLIVDKNIVTLGTDEAFALRDNDGQIRAYKQRVRLSIADSTLVQIGGSKVNNAWVPNYTISAQGYEVLNEATGTCIIMPEKVLVNGTHQMNPFVERDTANGRILAVYARAIAFRFSSKGIPQVSDWTTIFDTPSYRMIDLLAKAKKLPQAFRLLPQAMSPNTEEGEEKSTWARYPFDESTSLWINTSHEEALQWFGEIINREKKAMDFAQTFARRNASKHLHGLQKAPGPTWDIPVLCWRPTSGNIVKWDATQYAQLQTRVGGMIESPGKEFKSPPRITSGAESVSDEAGFDKLEAETDPEDGPIDITPGQEAPPAEPIEDRPGKNQTHKAWQNPAETPPTESPEGEKPEATVISVLDEESSTVLKQYHLVKESMWDEYEAACQELGMSPGVTHSVQGAKAILAKMNEMFI